MSSRLEPRTARWGRLPQILDVDVAREPEPGFDVGAPGIKVFVEFVIEVFKRKLFLGGIGPVYSNDCEVLILHPDPSSKSRPFGFWGSFHVKNVAAYLTKKYALASFRRC